MTAPAAQPDEAAELVEKCARAMADESSLTGETMFGWPELSDGMQDYWRGLARAAHSVLDPAIREQHGEQVIRRLNSNAEFRMRYGSAAVDAVRAGIARGQTHAD